MTPGVSVCVCTMNRPEELERCLEALSRSSIAPLEIIVSDDSREELSGTIHGIAERFPRVRYVRGPRRGVSANRNNTVRHASGALVTFVDDDVLVGPDYLQRGVEEHALALAARPDGRYILTGSPTVAGRLTPPANLSFLGFYNRPLMPGGRLNALCMSCVFFPRRFFEQAAFDENIFYGTEERDIGLQAVELGYEILYSPRLTIDHQPSEINRDLYDPVIDMARFYFGLKRYWVYERSPLKFAAYNVYALLNGVGSRLKRGRGSEALRLIGSFLEAWRRFGAMVLRSRSGGLIKAAR
ncbi:MAG TPA: glycosyltransferase [Candidatus Polarisedimenticolia bacterium]|nr:glycosyltransferase [Candidatus Polarisedimenticolia bacterium]